MNTLAAALPHLFSPFTIRRTRIRNRIMSTGHDTTLPTAFVPNDALIAYQQARAEGGVGLIVVQVAGVHETARYTSHLLMATDDACIPGYRRLAEACHAAGATVFGQLFHPGREILETAEGTSPVAYAPSAVPNQRFHIMPRPLSPAMIGEIVEGYGAAARRLESAGLDGVEIVGSHGYLPAQFVNPRVNRREDGYGGSLENRLRFLREAVAAVRARTGPDFVVGLRFSVEDRDLDGLTAAEAGEALAALDGTFDYFNLTVGSSATFGGATHIAPAMAYAPAYGAPAAAAIKRRVNTPVFYTGRVNQPQDAERLVAAGEADMVGMTRALICDPTMPAKAQEGRFDDIRACIACNQACIGHFQLGVPISCIQHPETGRELSYGRPSPAAVVKTVLVAGGGPAGLKAAAVAAARGHRVTLYEASERLGGQALLAQLLPRRLEFGGIVTNLTREAELAGVAVVRRTRVDRALVERERPDVVIAATGATPRRPDLPGAETAHVVTAWQVLREEVNVGASVLVADWRCDWIGMGVAEKLARAGCKVRLAVNGYMPGQRIQAYVRDQWAGVLHDLGVEVTPYADLYGVDGQTVYLAHVTGKEPIIVEGVDTLVTSLGHDAARGLEEELAGFGGELHVIGDCLTPRTAEEAVLEGLRAGWAI
ncbi:oxidoreductase [Labrys wisconsinensis]|uniref:2,4-dienoyl-CoA reductase-like NADH-dependent reductase (Old Yellow Enzyme family) n=1 Tax=Labrys wisconsinensis TaxID=425677 RepID=A0ABU0JL94_9HYPH|nr:FAD-dependent oxidoreductase [Labrys wisconsinensis]MDQ0475054.1 2,4-dienoyl-CoA reductase-like NADH-dependent reductase (Old Yellow Enzyme family) [Labrys wisconsinensis]